MLELPATEMALLLARIQFACNITFHILFPTISIALAWVLLFFKLAHNRTQDSKWSLAYGFWIKIFALTFALGVVSGVTMSFQFGTNWPGYMERVGNIAGPLLAYEVLTAFFLEATFLGVMLFGQRRVSRAVHTMATVLVAVGTSLSAFWILALNSWMQTPAGFVLVDGKAQVTSWFEVIFNPSFPYRLGHMLLASGLTVAFLLAGISAYRWLKGQQTDEVRASLKTGLILAASLIPLQIVMGDLHGLNTLKHQPAKVAAMEGIWFDTRGADALLFAIPDSNSRSNSFEIAIPKLASLYLTHQWDGEVKGLSSFAHQPPVAPIFYAFRVMVAVGVLMLLVSWYGCWSLRRGAISAGLARVLVAMTFSGWLALVAGWYVTEMGRQPWLVYGVLTTREAASQVASPLIATSLVAYLSLYGFLLVSYISVLFYMARKAGLIAAELKPELQPPIQRLGEY